MTQIENKGTRDTRLQNRALGPFRFVISACSFWALNFLLHFMRLIKSEYKPSKSFRLFLGLWNDPFWPPTRRAKGPNESPGWFILYPSNIPMESTQLKIKNISHDLTEASPHFSSCFVLGFFFIDAKSHANTEWQKRWNQSPSVSHWRVCYWSALELRVSKLPILGMGDLPPLMTVILIMGPYKTPTIGLMSLSPIIWK